MVKERVLKASPEELWPLVSEPERLPEWFTFAESVEVTGERRRTMHGRWGKKRSEIDQEIVELEPGRAIGWRHVAERLDGKPAPRFAKHTLFTIRLEPREDGTRVVLHSKQEPASRLKGLVMRLFGTREVAQNLERSLERLARGTEDAGPETP